MSDAAFVNTLAGNPRAVIGGNQPPLAEQLVEELATDAARADELIAAADGARIANDEDAAKVATLDGLARDHEKKLDRWHKDRKQPILDAGREVDRAHHKIAEPLAAARRHLGAMLTVWQRRREEEARRERERLAAEQRRREEEAERARQAAEAAKAKGSGALNAELDAIRAQEEADKLARQAETIWPEPIRTMVGTVGTRRQIAFDVTDEKKALAWAYRSRRNETTQFLRTVIGKHLQSLGVDAVESGNVDIPGVIARIEKIAQVR
jgi:hypothetical protein